MNKTALVLLIVGVALAAFLMVAAVAAFVFLPYMQDLMAGAPQGPVLVYEVDPGSLTGGQGVDMNKLAKAIDRRLGVGRNRLARVRILDDRRIEVSVMGKGEDDRLRVEKLLAGVGSLEFRILANRHDNKDLIEHALADPSKAKLRDDKGNLEAWRVHVKAGQESSLANSSDIAVRTKKMKAGRPTFEVLVLNDDYNITGAYLRSVNAGIDSQGKLCITFAFGRAGGQLFGQLTSSHLPDKLTGFAYRLGIILDNELYSAPSIRSTIYDSGQITGSFTDEEVQDIVNVLNAGSLPAKIRPVKK